MELGRIEKDLASESHKPLLRVYSLRISLRFTILEKIGSGKTPCLLHASKK